MKLPIRYKFAVVLVRFMRWIGHPLSIHVGGGKYMELSVRNTALLIFVLADKQE